MIARRLMVGAAAICLSGSAMAWDHAGHMLVGQVAWDQLKPATRDRVSELVKILPAQHNGNQTYNFVTAGCWMDDMRSEPGYAWSKLHYVNIAWTPDDSVFAIPEPPHVISGINEAREKLKHRDTLSADQQAQALAMLVHFVGDLHQPMHATERNDRGGNGFLLSGVTISSLAPKRPCTLHFLWDAAFRLGDIGGAPGELWKQPEIPERPQAPGDGVIAAEAAKLESRFPKAAQSDLGLPLDPELWARESHYLGCYLGYPEGQAPSDTEIHPVPAAFVLRSADTAAKRVTIAGYRLAAVLEELFGNP